MDYNKKLEGLELLYYLMTRFNMTYNNAVRNMVENNQNMEFLKDLNIDDNHINLHSEGGCDND